MSRAPRRRWTVREVELLPQSGDLRYEIIDGELFVTRAPHRDRQDVVGQICTALNVWSFETRAGKAYTTPGLAISESDNVIPDVIWVSTERLAAPADESGHFTGCPELTVEVLSAGAENIRRDREAKLAFYAKQGVREYWIADRFARRLEIYRRDGAQLVLTATLPAEDAVTSPLLPGFALPLARVWPQQLECDRVYIPRSHSARDALTAACWSSCRSRFVSLRAERRSRNASGISMKRASRTVRSDRRASCTTPCSAASSAAYSSKKLTKGIWFSS